MSNRFIITLDEKANYDELVDKLSAAGLTVDDADARTNEWLKMGLQICGKATAAAAKKLAKVKGVLAVEPDSQRFAT